MKAFSTGYFSVAAYVGPIQQKLYQKVGGVRKVKKGGVLWKRGRV